MKPCSRCGKPVDRPASTDGRVPRYCRDCQNAYMREWRKSHPLSEEERRKDICRSYTAVLVKRGRLVKRPCWICGAEQVQAHHPDYSLPALVVWLCRDHHRILHERLRMERT